MPDNEEVRCAEGRISILMEEYKALRDEINQRLASRLTLLGFLVASAALLGSDRVPAPWVAAVVGFLIACGGLVWAWSGRVLGKLSAGITRLEDRVNTEARLAYDVRPDASLLEWEHYMSRARNPFLRRLMARTRHSS